MTREQLEAFAEALAEEYELLYRLADAAHGDGRHEEANRMRQSGRIFMGLSKVCTKVAAKEAADPSAGRTKRTGKAA